MDEKLKTEAKSAALKKVANYFILACNSIDELEKKASVQLEEGSWRVLGQPFVFREQVCQAFTLLGRGQSR